MRIQVVETLEEFGDLSEAWAGLVTRCASPSVFLTHEWYECWWEAFGRCHRPSVLCAWEGDTLVGAAALSTDSVHFRGLPVRRLAYPLNGVTGQAGFLAPSGRRDVFDALLGHIARTLKWQFLELRRMPCESEGWKWLLEDLPSVKLRVAVRPDHQVPIIEINGKWETFLASRSKTFRKTIRRRLARIESHTEPVRVVRLTTPADILAALPAMFQVSSHSWKAQQKQALSDQPRAREFYRLLSERMGPLGRTELWMEYIGAEPAAFEYHLRFAGVTYPIRADFDLRFADLSPGAHLEYEVLRQLYEDPAHEVREYNTCADGYAYERKWTDTIRPHGRAWLFKPTMYGRLLHLLSRARRPVILENRPPRSCRPPARVPDAVSAKE